MNIDHNDEYLLLRDTTRNFITREIKPIADKIDEQEEIPRGLINKLTEMGFLGTAFSEEHGGGGFGEIGYCLTKRKSPGAADLLLLSLLHIFQSVQAQYLSAVLMHEIPKTCRILVPETKSKLLH